MASCGEYPDDLISPHWAAAGELHAMNGGFPKIGLSTNALGHGGGRKQKWSDRWTIALERRYYVRARIIVAHSKLMRDELPN
jgi:hypothetical protein